MRSLTVKHSGGVGAIVYSIPALLSLVSQHRIERVTYYLQLNQHVQYSGRHPLGNLLLDATFAERLKPLLLSQACVQHVEIYNGQAVDVDFDLFRRVPINFTTYSIPGW